MKALARAALVVLTFGGAAQAADEPAPLPTYSVGHLWPLAAATYELTRIEDGQYVFEAPEREIRLTTSLGLAAVRVGDRYLTLPAPPDLSWPLKPGEWGAAPGGWRASAGAQTIFARNGMRLMPERIVWRVEGWEDVALSGRTIRALKILYQALASALSARDVVEWEIAMWYAPDAGVFIKAEDPTLGVVDFELAASADLAALHAHGGLPDPAPPPAASLDSRRRHRRAVLETCDARKCSPPAPITTLP